MWKKSIRVTDGRKKLEVPFLGYLSLTKTLSKTFSFQGCSVLLRVSGAEMIVVSHVFQSLVDTVCRWIRDMPLVKKHRMSS